MQRRWKELISLRLELASRTNTVTNVTAFVGGLEYLYIKTFREEYVTCPSVVTLLRTPLFRITSVQGSSQWLVKGNCIKQATIDFFNPAASDLVLNAFSLSGMSSPTHVLNQGMQEQITVFPNDGYLLLHDGVMKIIVQSYETCMNIAIVSHQDILLGGHLLDGCSGSVNLNRRPGKAPQPCATLNPYGVEPFNSMCRFSVEYEQRRCQACNPLSG